MLDVDISNVDTKWRDAKIINDNPEKNINKKIILDFSSFFWRFKKACARPIWAAPSSCLSIVFCVVDSWFSNWEYSSWQDFFNESNSAFSFLYISNISLYLLLGGSLESIIWDIVFIFSDVIFWFAKLNVVLYIVFIMIVFILLFLVFKFDIILFVWFKWVSK